MNILIGQKASAGIAIGKIHYLRRKRQDVPVYAITDIQKELERVKSACTIAVGQLETIYKNALEKMGEEAANLFEIHAMMLKDLDYQEFVVGIITEQKTNAEDAIAQTADHFAQMFLDMDNPYMHTRAADVRDISGRVLDILQGNSSASIFAKEPLIIAAEDLTPSETVQLDKQVILALVTSGGSVNSHTAIFARSMGIPAVVALGEALTAECDGLQAIVDGDAGKFYLEPDAAKIETMSRVSEQRRQEKEALKGFIGLPNVTLDGKAIQVFANIGNPGDLDAVLANDAGGIGLFRSEFIYMESKDYPTEEVQYTAYKTVAEKMQGKPVIIRTLDIGADKQAAYFQIPQEENPALGFRALRICLKRPELFITQLRALYRASVYGNILIMFPMVTSLWEVVKAKTIAAEVRKQLTEEKIPFSPKVPLGIMIETPAAAIISDTLAKAVDFFSIGTNDLIQYTLAADRQNNRITEFVDPHHPAVLRLIQTAADNAHKAGIPIGICGELGADMELTETFLRMGIDELSVSPSAILPLRKKIRAIKLN